MYHMQPIKVLLRRIEEVQIFLLEKPDKGRQLSEVNIIDHDLNKLSKTGGMYVKALNNWNWLTPDERKTWFQLRKVMGDQYEKCWPEYLALTCSKKDGARHKTPLEPWITIYIPLPKA